MRIAAIDIGSNSLRCTIVDAPAGGQRVTLDEGRAYVRLGRGTRETGRLADDAMDAAIAALGRMLRTAREYEVTHIRAVATAAVREASNGEAFVARLRDELGLEVEVISSEHEGRLALLSAVDSLALEGALVVMDIGGGSAEIVRAHGRDLLSITSLPLGAVVLSEGFGSADLVPESDYRRLSEHVRRVLAEGLGADGTTEKLIGSGGTVTTLAAMVAAGREPGLASIHGFEMSRLEVTRLREMLARSTAGERAAMKGMTPGRVDLIVAGAVVLDEAMAALGAASIVANARGMREGIVIEAVERELGAVPAADRMRPVRDFCRQCRIEVPHAEQVRRLALKLFDGLAPLLDLDVATRPLLEAAALLHDVGYHVSPARHHKHSYRLISDAGLPGFSESELRLVASIARYHAGSLPKEKHEAWRGLGEEDRRTAGRLAALLRLADGLDRAHTQVIEQIETDLDAERLRLGISGTGSLDVEVHAAMHKADLFERVWERRVEIVEVAAPDSER